MTACDDDNATSRRNYLSDTVLDVKPINLLSHAEVCAQFRIDSYVCSVGTAQGFLGEDGKGTLRYLEWLRGKIEELPGSCVHLWDRARVVGQIEVGLQPKGSASGYIYLVYLIPEYRGGGLGRHLLQQAEAFLVGQGAVEARLRVSPTNVPAFQLYRKNGWSPVSEEPDGEGLLVMHKRF